MRINLGFFFIANKFIFYSQEIIESTVTKSILRELNYNGKDYNAKQQQHFLRNFQNNLSLVGLHL